MLSVIVVVFVLSSFYTKDNFQRSLAAAARPFFAFKWIVCSAQLVARLVIRPTALNAFDFLFVRRRCFCDSAVGNLSVEIVEHSGAIFVGRPRYSEVHMSL